MNGNVRVIQSLQRAFEIINCFGIDTPQLKLPEIADSVGIHVNTARGLVNSLVYYGYLAHLEHTNEYCLGPVFVQKSEMAVAYVNSHLYSLAQPFLSDLANSYHVSARLQILPGGRLFTLITKHPIRSRYILLSRAGLDFPLHASASGKLFLSFYEPKYIRKLQAELPLPAYTSNTITSPEALQLEIEKTRERGYSLESEETEYGIKSIAVPLFREEKLIGTVSATAPSQIIDQYSGELVLAMQAFSNDVRTTE